MGMRKYVVHQDAYIFDDGPSMFMVEEKDDDTVIFNAFEIDEDEKAEFEDGDGNVLSDKEIIEKLSNDNGDGGPFVTIFSVDDDKIIFPLDN
jgi:hypothetical protein